jgi:hypothetical protein
MTINNHDIYRFRLICAQLDRCRESAQHKLEYLSNAQQLIQLVESQAGTSSSGHDVKEIQPLVCLFNTPGTSLTTKIFLVERTNRRLIEAIANTFSRIGTPSRFTCCGLAFNERATLPQR